MRKIMTLLIAMLLIALTFMSSSVFAQYIEAPVGTTHEDTSLWFGKAVRNIQGDYLGTVKSFARDSDGKVSFAIVSHKFLFGLREQKVAIPLRDLTYNAEKQYYTCAISQDQFNNAPEFKNTAQLRDRSFAGELDRYFGQQPYWTENSMGEKTK
jgi:hypothetical protein